MACSLYALQSAIVLSGSQNAANTVWVNSAKVLTRVFVTMGKDGNVEA
jgi:hypothetical protein